MAALIDDQDGGRLTQLESRDDRAPRFVGGDARPRRDRPVVAAIAVVALVLAGGPIADAVAAAVAGEPAPAGSGPVASVGVEEGEGGGYLVRPGQTYWSIAEELAGTGDIRARVDALQAANDGRGLRAGDRLAVPTAAQAPAGTRR